MSKRSVLQALTTSGMILLFCSGGESHAKANDLQTACHLTIEPKEPTPNPTHILSTVQFQFAVQYDAACHIKVLPTAKSPMLCSTPQIDIEPAQTPEQFRANIFVPCQFKRPGFYYSPPIALEISKNDHATAQNIPLKLQKVTIKPYLNPDNASIPLEDTLEIRPWIQTGGYLGLLGMLIGLGLFGIVFGCLRWRKNQTIPQIQTPPPPPPVKIFLAEIATLIDITPQTIEEYKRYHDKLSNGLRQYLSAKTKLNVLNCTTSQLAAQLTQTDLTDVLQQEIIRLLSASDVVKFTRNMPGSAANLKLLRDCEKLAENIETFYQTIENPPEQTTTNPRDHETTP